MNDVNDLDVNIYHCNDGRVRVYLKDSHKVMSYPKYIMEKHLGRELKDNEQVHHKDGNPLNNNINNLDVVTFEEHLDIHANQNRKYYDRTMVCPWCKKEFTWTAKQQSYFNRNIKRGRYKNSLKEPFCSKSCAGKYGREIQLNKNNIE